MQNIPIGISNRHAHLTQAHIEALFGEGYQLTFLRNIKQPDEFVSGETIDVVGPKGTISSVRILGPARSLSQVELSMTNARNIGVEINVRISQDLIGTAGIKLVGPKGEVDLMEGAIIPIRHIHLNPQEAKELHLIEGQVVAVKTEGPRSITFENIVVRIHPLFSLELHLDADEANAAGVKKGDMGTLIL